MRGPWHAAQCRAYISEPLLTCSDLSASCADAGIAKASSEPTRIVFFTRAVSIGQKGKRPYGPARLDLPRSLPLCRSPAAEARQHGDVLAAIVGVSDRLGIDSGAGLELPHDPARILVDRDEFAGQLAGEHQSASSGQHSGPHREFD